MKTAEFNSRSDAAEKLIALNGWRVEKSKAGGLQDCSLIVATYMRPVELLELMQCLSSISDGPAEVVIVDGAPGGLSESSVHNWVCQTPLPFELIYIRGPKGLTLQRNVGIDISTKPFVFFLDDDSLPLPGYFQEVRRVLSEPAEPRVGAVGACVMNEINKPLPRRWRLRRALRLVPRCEPFIYSQAGTSVPTGLLKPFRGIRDVDFFPGSAFAVRGEIFQSMRFSEFFAGYSYGEDVEMALRIRQQWRVVCCGDARVIHRASPAGRPPSFEKGQMEVRNRHFIWRRHCPRASIVNQARFYIDFLFLFLMDLAWFLARPWKWQHLSHACGLAWGSASCAIRAPKWQEPPVARRYRLGDSGYAA